MRKKSVGLLGNAKGQERPIPFVEDTAVPPENLADFIMEFRKVLDDRALAYGMFGHVDAGVLHVRPAIDMKDERQESLIREVTDQVVALTVKYKGLLWGEHGKGVRSEYSPEFFGELYPELQKIKAAFDPRNQMNPGKIATPAIGGLNCLKLIKCQPVVSLIVRSALLCGKSMIQRCSVTAMGLVLTTIRMMRCAPHGKGLDSVLIRLKVVHRSFVNGFA